MGLIIDKTMWKHSSNTIQKPATPILKICEQIFPSQRRSTILILLLIWRPHTMPLLEIFITESFRCRSNVFFWCASRSDIRTISYFILHILLSRHCTVCPDQFPCHFGQGQDFPRPDDGQGSISRDFYDLLRAWKAESCTVQEFVQTSESCLQSKPWL